MRCFLMKKGRIESVEMLTAAPDDGLIAQAKEHFERRKSEDRFDAFEVWTTLAGFTRGPIVSRQTPERQERDISGEAV